MRRSRRGFTLLEVIVTVAIVAVLAGGMLAFLNDVNARQRFLGEESQRARGVSAFFEALENDLATTAAFDPVHGAGLRGDETRLRVLSRGVGVGGAEGLEVSGETRVREFSLAGGVLRIGETVAAERIGRVRFRYHDGSAWRSSFDSSSAGGLAAAVEVSIWHERVTASPVPLSEFEDEDAPAAEAEEAPDRVRVLAVFDGPGAAQRGDR